MFSSCLSFFPWSSLCTHVHIQYTHRHIYQGFYNTVCLTTHKHTAGRVAQSKHSAYRHTHRPLALLKRPTLGSNPASNTTRLSTATLPGVCHADMYIMCSESSGSHEAKSSTKWPCPATMSVIIKCVFIEEVGVLWIHCKKNHAGI